MGIARAEVAPRALIALRYRMTNNVFQEVGDLPGQSLIPLKQPGEELISEPSYASGQPLYLKATLGRGLDSQYTLVLDRSKGSTGDYDLLYVDRDNDEDLNEEKPLLGYRREGAFWFGPIPLLLVGKNGPYIYHFFCIYRIYHSQGGSRRSIGLYSAGYYLGRANIGGARHSLAVVDADGNGVFNDLSTALGGGDRVLIDLNDDGLFEVDSEDSEEVYSLSAFLPVRDRYYALTLPPEGGALTLAEPTLVFGTLRTGLANFALKMGSDQGFFTFRSPKPELHIPIGIYQLQACTIEVKDAAGDVWKCFGRFPNKKEALLPIRKKEVTVLKLGPPLKVWAVPQVREEQVEFSLKVTGGAGEEYGEFFKNGRRVSPPRLHIADPAGQAIGIYNFAYQRGSGYSLLWQDPRRRSGLFTATVDFDLGPLASSKGATVSFTIPPSARNVLQRRGSSP